MLIQRSCLSAVPFRVCFSSSSSTPNFAIHKGRFSVTLTNNCYDDSIAAGRINGPGFLYLRQVTTPPTRRTRPHQPGHQRGGSLQIPAGEEHQPLGQAYEFHGHGGQGSVHPILERPPRQHHHGWQDRQRTGSTRNPWTNISHSTASTTSHTVTGLTNGTTYTFQVRARAGHSTRRSIGCEAGNAAAEASGAVRFCHLQRRRGCGQSHGHRGAERLPGLQQGHQRLLQRGQQARPSRAPTSPTRMARCP